MGYLFRVLQAWMDLLVFHGWGSQYHLAKNIKINFRIQTFAVLL